MSTRSLSRNRWGLLAFSLLGCQGLVEADSGTYELQGTIVTFGGYRVREDGLCGPPNAPLKSELEWFYHGNDFTVVGGCNLPVRGAPSELPLEVRGLECDLSGTALEDIGVKSRKITELSMRNGRFTVSWEDVVSIPNNEEALTCGTAQGTYEVRSE